MTPTNLPPTAPPVTFADLLKLTVEQYHHMGETGVLTPDDRVELLEGLLASKPMKNPPHRIATAKTRNALAALLPAGWYLDSQEPITLDDSEPEPDLAIVCGKTEDYDTRHPGPTEVALLVEVADTSLARDRDWKKRVYARNNIPVYWIVNLVDRVLETYSAPSGPVLTPDYGTAKFLTPADRADVLIAGTVVGSVAVVNLLP
jgi:Uma2 family endonuclease